MSLSVIIPTLQAGQQLQRLLSSLAGQSTPPEEIIVVDSSSTDETVEIARGNGCKVHLLNRDEFRHGRTRNLGAGFAQGSCLVFITQDALPVDAIFLEELVRPLLEGQASAATARQIAYPEANPIEQFSRAFNYPEKSHVRTLHDLPRLGIKTYFFSNTASAFDRNIFESSGGFSEEVIVDEDLELCARLLHNGFAVAYQAEAKVYHSHDYSPAQLFRRYFDIGVFFSQAGSTILNAPTQSEGTRFLIAATRRLIATHSWRWIPRLFMESGVKLIAFQLGIHHRRLPARSRRSLSGQAYFWEQESPGNS